MRPKITDGPIQMCVWGRTEFAGVEMSDSDPQFSLPARLSGGRTDAAGSPGEIILPSGSRLTAAEIERVRRHGLIDAALSVLGDDFAGGDLEQDDGPVVFLAPYLPLTRLVRMGAWDLIPFDEWRFDRATAPEIGLEVRRAALSYDPAADEYPFGAIIVPADRRVGEWVDPRLQRPLARTVLAASLDCLPPLDGHDSWCFDCRRQVLTTAENAIVFAYPLHGQYVHYSSGGMVRRMVTELREDYAELPHSVPPPDDLYLPAQAQNLDGVYAGDLYTLLERDDALGRRLDVVIGWLEVATSNATAMIAEVRVLAFRSAFEILLGAGAQTGALRRALGRLLEPDGIRQPREWQERGRVRAAELTDLEWWFQNFALLRNAIAHGGSLDATLWQWMGISHLQVAQEVLVRAIRRTVEEETRAPGAVGADRP